MPDGNIREFIHFQGDSQEYFVTNERSARFGELKEWAHLCSEVAMAVDAFPPPGWPAEAGPTGFEDGPLYIGGWLNGTGFNVGRMFAYFNPELDPDGDSSNGSGVYFIGLDVSAPASLDKQFGTHAVAFDVDGDGSRLYNNEYPIREAPIQREDAYIFRLDTNVDGIMDVDIIIGERRTLVPTGAAVLDVKGQPQRIEGFSVRRYVEMRDQTALLTGSSSELLVWHLDFNQDGVVNWRDIGVNADVEFAILNVTALPFNADDPDHVWFLVIADAADDGWEDIMIFDVEFPHLSTAAMQPRPMNPVQPVAIVPH